MWVSWKRALAELVSVSWEASHRSRRRRHVTEVAFAGIEEGGRRVKYHVS